MGLVRVSPTLSPASNTMQRSLVFQKRQQRHDFVSVDGSKGLTGAARGHGKKGVIRLLGGL